MLYAPTPLHYGKLQKKLTEMHIFVGFFVYVWENVPTSPVFSLSCWFGRIKKAMVFYRQNIDQKYSGLHTCPTLHSLSVNAFDIYLSLSDGSLRIATLSDKTPCGNYFLVGLI